MGSYVLTKMYLKGEKKELNTVLKVLKDKSQDNYDKNGGWYFHLAEVKNETFSKMLMEMSDEEIDAIEKEIYVSSMGPYGDYKELEEVNVFEIMAETAPSMYFEGSVKGNINGDIAAIEAKLENGKLWKRNYLERDGQVEEEYLGMVAEKFPFEKFCEVFELNAEDIDEDMYIDFVSDAIEPKGKIEMIYEEFGIIYNEIEVSKETFDEAIAAINDMEFISQTEYSHATESKRWAEPVIYDPVAKNYE